MDYWIRNNAVRNKMLSLLHFLLCAHVKILLNTSTWWILGCAFTSLRSGTLEQYSCLISVKKMSMFCSDAAKFFSTLRSIKAYKDSLRFSILFRNGSTACIRSMIGHVWQRQHFCRPSKTQLGSWFFLLWWEWVQLFTFGVHLKGNARKTTECNL